MKSAIKKVLVGIVTIILLQACKFDSDQIITDGPFAENSSPSILGIWVDENLHTCMFPSLEKLNCDRLALNEWLISNKNRDYNYFIESKDQIKTFEDENLWLTDEIDNRGFTTIRAIRSARNQPDQLKREQFILSPDPKVLFRHTLIKEDITGAHFKIIKTERYVSVTEDQFETIKVFRNDLKRKGPFNPGNDHYKERIIKSQAQIITQIIDQGGQGPHEFIAINGWAPFRLNLSKELVNSWKKRKSPSDFLRLYQGLTSLDSVNFYGIPTCVLFPEGIDQISSHQNYTAEIDPYVTERNRVTFYVYPDVPADHYGWRKLALRIYCSKNYSEEEITFADLDYTLGDFISINPILN